MMSVLVQAQAKDYLDITTYTDAWKKKKDSQRKRAQDWDNSRQIQYAL